MNYLDFVRTGPLTICLGLALFSAAPAWGKESAEAILKRFVEDYRSDPMLVDSTFGIDIAGDRFHVVARPAEDGPASVTLQPGFPDRDIWYFTLQNLSVLHELDERRINAGTAMGKASASDSAPMDIGQTGGFQPAEGFLNEVLKTTFHFWNRGFPEFIPFNEDATRFVHGTDLLVFYYQPGFRSAWFSIKRGHHVNADPDSRTNPFPSLMVFTSGKGRARIGGREAIVTEGQALFIPPGVSHEFFNDGGAPLQGILLMFGEGA